MEALLEHLIKMEDLLNRRPRNEGEFRDYFFTLIGRKLEQPANDYREVLSKAYPWNGELERIPDGPGPNVKLGPNAPFYGLTQQWSGEPKGRIFLPTAAPDSNRFYTRN